MYYTYRYKKKDRQINIDDVLDSLFAGVEYNEPVERVNAVYQNLSYERYRTINIAPTNMTETQVQHTQRYISRIKSLTTQIESWLLQNQAKIQYKTFKIPKATGGFREINAPEYDLMKYMREIKAEFEHIGVLPHDSAYAYIKERDCKKALQRHQEHSANWFLKLDIEKFFDNCNPEFIRRQLKLIYPFTLMEDSWYNRFIDSLCALACLDNKLPQGTPLSPLLTNWLMVPIDHKINKLLNNIEGNFFTYTRYADDMLISSMVHFDPNEVVSLIKALFLEENLPFNIKDAKTRYGSKAGRNWNLGIMYNKDNNLTVGYRRKRRIKTMLFQWYQGNQELDYAYELQGELSYLHNIEPEYCKGMLEQMNNKYGYNFLQEIRRVIKES